MLDELSGLYILSSDLTGYILDLEISWAFIAYMRILNEFFYLFNYWTLVF